MAAAHSRVADTERSHYSSAAAADPAGSQDSSACGKEAAQAVWQKVDAERRAEACQAAQQAAEQDLKMAQLEVARLKVWHFVVQNVLCALTSSVNPCHEETRYKDNATKETRAREGAHVSREGAHGPCLL